MSAAIPSQVSLRDLRRVVEALVPPAEARRPPEPVERDRVDAGLREPHRELDVVVMQAADVGQDHDRRRSSGPRPAPRTRVRRLPSAAVSVSSRRIEARRRRSAGSAVASHGRSTWAAPAHVSRQIRGTAHDAPMDRFRFGRSVQALRQRRNWRQADLAARAGLSRSVIGRIELGQSRRIALGDLAAVARALDGQLGLDFRWRGEQLDRLSTSVTRRLSIERSRSTAIGAVGRRGRGHVLDLRRARLDRRVRVPSGRAGRGRQRDQGVDRRRGQHRDRRRSEVAPGAADRGATAAGRVAASLGSSSSPTDRRPGTGSPATRTRSGRRSPRALGSASAWIRDPTGPPPRGIIFVTPAMPRRR